jgi:hypothetical protein
MTGHTVCINPAIYPNKELIWYINNIDKLKPINWLIRDKNLNNNLNLVSPFYQIDIEQLRSNTRRYNNENPMPDNIENLMDAQLAMFHYDDEDDYADRLKSIEWQQKRFEIFNNFKFKCANNECGKFATFSMFMGVGINQTKHYSIGDFYNTNRNSGDVRWNSIKTTLMFFKSLRIPFTTISNFRYNETTDNRVILDLHHRYYIQGRKPWEYNDDCFLPLCRECHNNVHLNQAIPLYQENSINSEIINENLQLIQCDRCHGEGYISRYQHIQNGICFKCWGDGFFSDSIYN